MTLDSDITSIKGVGERAASLFHKLDIYRVRDLLFYFPRDYEPFAGPLGVMEATSHVGEVVAVRCTIAEAPVTRMTKAGRNLTTVRLVEHSAVITVPFFNQAYLAKMIKTGVTYVFRGMLAIGYRGEVTLEQAKCYKLSDYEKLTGTLQPVYSLTKGLTGKSIGKAVRQIFDAGAVPEDILPGDVAKEARMDSLSYAEALYALHFPTDTEALARARSRIAFGEFFLYSLMLRDGRTVTEKLHNVTPMIDTGETARFVESLPYTLTAAQSRVIAEIDGDMTGEHVMSRLIQGDVGSGKTVVAFWAMILAASNGYQSVIMAPTEVLARQHYANMLERLAASKLPYVPVLLVGAMSGGAKAAAKAALADNRAQFAIGTTATIQEDVGFANLALVITDEQHRFGVRQRGNLQSKGQLPHVLVMSATPIPRSLAILLCGDMHLSVMNEKPKGRLPIKNAVVGPAGRAAAYRLIAREVAAGHQAYCICPLVEATEATAAQNVYDYAIALKAALPSEISVDVLHGRMKTQEKNEVMARFAEGKTDVLVSTTVIEVGIDVPGATVMIIEDAQRFGLSQLHQLRGRIGRGEAQSYCVFINTGAPDCERLKVISGTNDGFEIASEDLRLRGPGDLAGVRQSGILDFGVADIYRDAAVLKEASEAASRHYEELARSGYLDSLVGSGIWNGVDFRTI